MGNALLDENLKEDPVQIYEQWLEQNPDLVGRQILSHNKLFETDFFQYSSSSIKMCVFFRRDSTPLQDYLKAFQTIQALVQRYKCMHILPMRILEFKQFRDKELQKYEQNFAIAARQYLHLTLEQRLEGRPCLSEEEKVWVIYQMIFAVYTIHEVFNVYHGNIRTSNFLLTTYHYLILTDFASYKPNYILQDTQQGLSEFRLFYGSSVEKCNLAPQKMAGRDNLPSSILNSKKLFNTDPQQPDTSRQSAKASMDSSRNIKKNSFQQDSEAQIQINKLKTMDMFSLGLTILEVINDGRPSLNYQQLLKLKKEGLKLDDKINEAINKLTKGKEVTSDILNGLLKQKPEDRPSITRVLQKYVSIIHLDTSALFWCVLSAFNKTSFSSCDLRLHLIYSLLRFIEEQIRQSSYTFHRHPPLCLNGFKSLKIFVEMIEKKIIFSPKVEHSLLFERLLRHFENVEGLGREITEEEVLFEDEDERRKFFINPAKKGKIAKRLSSFGHETRLKEKELCPPNYNQLTHLLELKHVPLKLTQLGLRSPRLQQLLREYKSCQYLREQRLQQNKYYKNAQLIARIIFSCIRNCKYVASKLLAIELINFIGRDCTDQILLKVILPFHIHLTQDSDLIVSQEAFCSLLGLFYLFIDPFHCEEDLHYFQIVLEFFSNIIRTKQSRLRFILFSRFKEVYGVCEWLEVHCRRLHRQPKLPLLKLIETIKVNYGYYSREEIKVLLNSNIPEHLLSDMFEFYISLINTDRIEGLRLSLHLARNLPLPAHKQILDALDSCLQSGLDEYGIGLFYAIQYFTIRKSASHYVIRKIAPHVINPSKWIRDEAVGYVKMCLQQYPPTKSYFFFKDVFPPPFPLKPEDVEEDILLPSPLKENEVDLKDKRIKIERNCVTTRLFGDYIKTIKITKPGERTPTQKLRDQQLTLWSSTHRQLCEQSLNKSLNFQIYIKRQLQLLYEYIHKQYRYNLLYYILNMTTKYIPHDRDKSQKQDKQEKKYPELLLAFKKVSRFSMDLASIDHQKKQLFQQFEGTVSKFIIYIDSSFEKLLAKKNRENGEVVTDKLKLADSIIIIGEVLSKFEMFKIKPIPKLGSYLRQPTTPQKLPRPRGLLISQIFEHSDTITCLEKVADQFFLSGSADGSLKVFDARKIQINVTTTSEASLEIRGDGAEEKTKINSICTFEQTYSAVVGSNKGHIRVYPIDRLSHSRNGKNEEMMRYSVNGELQKITTFSNELKNECFCYITAQGNLGIQDIRLKSKSMGCNIGRQRGIPRSLCTTNRNSILVGTIDGYLINFDIRYNIVSSVLQLHNDKETLPITNIYSCPPQYDYTDQLYALTYPSKHYEFSYFNIHQNRAEFSPQRQYTSSVVDEVITTPYMVNRTGQEQFKLSRNGLIWRKTYDELSDFHKNFNIFDYLSDPLTRKQAKVRQVWMDNCKNRYNQIASMYNRKTLPFLQYLGTGLLTNCNPCHNAPSEHRTKLPFTLLTDKRENKDYNDIERVLNYKPQPFNKVVTFPGEENRDYYTCCRVLPNLVIVGCRNSLIKIFM